MSENYGKNNREQQLALFRESLENSASALSDDKAAKNQLSATLKWRAENAIDRIPVATRENNLPPLMPVRGFKSVQDANIAVDPFLSESTLRILQYLGGNSYHKTDKEGYPLLIDRAGYHRTKDIGNNVTATEMINYEVACAEFLTRVLNPECSETAGRYIHGQTMIFDCTDMSFWQFQMSAIQHFKAVMNVVQSYYPETLHKVFIVNASAVFVAMWKVMQTFVNARTLEKVHIIGQDYQNVLLEHIPAENLPTFLGGTCECKHLPGGCVPSSNMGNVPPLKYILGNEKVETAYITDVMDL